LLCQSLSSSLHSSLNLIFYKDLKPWKHQGGGVVIYKQVNKTNKTRGGGEGNKKKIGEEINANN
jgi:hypothetical protein